MEKDGIEFLKQLVRIQAPKSILEIGSAIGYSAIQMALAASEATITTIEKDADRYEQAVSNVREMSLAHRIHVIQQDALEFLSDERIDVSFDFIFIDAAKSKNKEFIEKVHPFLRRKGVIAIDNVLLKGYVSGEKKDSKRLMKLGEKINDFNHWMINHPKYETVITETGDGIAIAYKL